MTAHPRSARTAARPSAATAPFDADRIPYLLKQQPQWVVWRLERRRSGDTGLTKVPYAVQDGRLRHAKSNDPRTWMTYTQALDAAQQYGPAYGLGFMLTPNDPLMVLDMDPQVPMDEQHRRAKLLGGYTEFSPSGKGLHVWIRAHVDLPNQKEGTRRHGMELYRGWRFMTVTGHPTEYSPINVPTQNDAFEPFVLEYFPQPGRNRAAQGKRAVQPYTPLDAPAPQDVQDLLARAAQLRADTAQKFLDTWNGADDHYPDAGRPDASRADLGLCSLIALLTGKDEALVDTFYRQSPRYLGRPDRQFKWDGHATYRADTLSLACS